MKEYFTILHVLGVVIGMGGAFASDAMFFYSIKDKMLSKTELGFMKIGSTLVWTGLGIILISGLLLFSTDPAAYAASSKFQLKMTIVAIITLNGIIFHRSHIPRMHRHAEHHLPSSDEFMRTRPYLLASGAISATSWMCAFLLGMFRSIPVSYIYGLAVYFVIIGFAIATAYAIKNFLIPHHRN